MKCEPKKGLIIKLPHTKKEIDGFGYSQLSSIFWWFGTSDKILYHYRYGNEVSQTQYLDLPDGVNKERYNILGYLEDSSSLVLNAL